MPNLSLPQTPGNSPPKLDLNLVILKSGQPSLPRLLRLLTPWLLFLVALSGCGTPVTETQVRGRPVTIDRLYPPGLGPVSSQDLTLLTTYPEKLWLTGIDVRVKGDADDSSVDGVLSGMTLGLSNVERHREIHALQGLLSPSLFHPTASTPSLRLPQGYGIPLMSNEVLYLSSVWQNRELYRQPLKARADTTLHFARPSEEKPLRELRVYPVHVTVPLAAGKGATDPEFRLVDPSKAYQDEDGQLVGNTWWIPSGLSQTSSLVAHQLPPNKELTVRYATSFLYEDWESFELYDLTTERSLLEFRPGETLAREFPDGLKVDSRHRLELRVSYRNRALSDHAGLAMLILYADP